MREIIWNCNALLLIWNKRKSVGCLKCYFDLMREFYKNNE